jgi:hypothetical protein
MRQVEELPVMQTNGKQNNIVLLCRQPAVPFCSVNKGALGSDHQLTLILPRYR